ncbi:hypothetical protein ACRQGF_09025, partial [Actinotignum sp. GS-2025c]|uniref:hypothetical protein n=1 Tax=Actinotignum sp. GS-2025c TaxID=3427276 RepID=UPI003F46D57A
HPAAGGCGRAYRVTAKVALNEPSQVQRIGNAPTIARLLAEYTVDLYIIISYRYASAVKYFDLLFSLSRKPEAYIIL